MRKLTKYEIYVTAFIFLTTFIITSLNLRVALRRSRDVQRRSDVGAISDALNAFHKDYGFYPPSHDGKIKICKGENFELVLSEALSDPKYDRAKLFGALSGCEWGKSSFSNVFADGTYLSSIPSDPFGDKGVSYLYLSDTDYYQIYTYLEGGKSEDTYNESIVGRNLNCGNKICSFGKSSADIPLGKSIEEYKRILESEKMRGV